MAMSSIGTATFQASITMPVWPMSPSAHTVLSTAVSIGMIMPWRLRNDSSSMSEITRKTSGMRRPIHADWLRSVSAIIGSPAAYTSTEPSRTVPIRSRTRCAIS